MAQRYTVEVTHEWRKTYVVVASDEAEAETVATGIAREEFCEEFDAQDCPSVSDFELVTL